MRSTLSMALCLLGLTASAVSAQISDLNPNAPKPGTQAPSLTFTELLQAPAGTKVDWPSLRGKVVVLEFWATWCAPCVAGIPVLNDLAASVDPGKVQFISIDDEDRAVVEAFLKKKPLSGWIGIDTSGEVLTRFGVISRPATMVVNPQGVIMTTTVPLEHLRSEQLLNIADGKPVTLGGDADPKLLAKFNEAMAQPFSFQGMIRGRGEKSDSIKPLFEISLTPGDPVKQGAKPPTHVMLETDGMDITNAPPSILLQYGTGVAATRIITSSNLPLALYNLHVVAPKTDPKHLAQTIEQAISSGTGLLIEHRTTVSDALVLTAEPGAASHLVQSPFPGMAMFHAETQTLQCLNASPDQLAIALEKALGASVVNETGLSGSFMISLKIASKDLSSANEALEKGLGLTLVKATRPVEFVILSVPDTATKESVPPSGATMPQPK